MLSTSNRSGILLSRENRSDSLLFSESDIGTVLPASG
jgi:hypothetical protein